MSDMAEVLKLLSEHFEGDLEKVGAWLVSENPIFGGVRPTTLFHMGRSHVVLRAIKNILWENGEIEEDPSKEARSVMEKYGKILQSEFIKNAKKSTKAKKPKKWKPTKFVAKCCGDIIFSGYPGQFVTCKCSGSFVDETRDYCRLGGNKRPEAI